MYMRSYGETGERMHDLWAIYVNFWDFKRSGNSSLANNCFAPLAQSDCCDYHARLFVNDDDENRLLRPYVNPRLESENHIGIWEKSL
jgi:hypothetical protein